MNEEQLERTSEENIPEAVVQTRKGFSIVWLIPLVAALVGGWLAYKTLSEKGPTITITFKDGKGLEAGKTKIKYKAVDIGEVTSVRLLDDLSGVVVRASLDKDAEPYLNDGLKFWVVRPHIGLSGISGLGTLVSGAYIEVEPGQGKSTKTFTALAQPPLLRADTPGQKYVLQTDNLGSIQDGSPIYYRDIQVGEVLGHELAEDEQSILIHVFVNSPHHQLVRENSRFWNASGLDVSVGADGVNVKTESLEALLLGGIAFESPITDGNMAAPSEAHTKFPLYKDYQSVETPTYTRKIHYVMYFDDSVRGLKVGAPVDFRGIQVGSVTGVKLEYDGDTMDLRIPVTVEIEPERVTEIGGKDTDPETVIDALIKRGLRAQLQTGSLLTGQLFVELDLHPDKPIRAVDAKSAYPQFPTILTTLDAFTHSADELLAKLGRLPLDQIANELLETIRGAKNLVNSPDLKKAPGSVNETLASFRATLASASDAMSMLEEDAPARVDLINTLEELAMGARSIRVLADYLERHPDSLVYGKSGPKGN